MVGFMAYNLMGYLKLKADKKIYIQLYDFKKQFIFNDNHLFAHSYMEIKYSYLIQISSIQLYSFI